MFDNVYADIKAYNSKMQKISFLKRVFYLFFQQELHAVLIYRFGRWANYQCKLPIVKPLAKIVYFFLNKSSEIIAGIGIWPECDIGPGLRIEHWGGVIIIAKRIGMNCRIQHQVTIGYLGAGLGGDVPTLGDKVFVGVGAKILGEVTIGNNVVIGANAVVINDIPDNAVAVGIPAKVVKIRS